ncbi:hypothetical protein G6O69_18430 [Pseudenhygromyxa sp. WMMC2535]|uniref:hypothetical protein n=1 Tax=Pseudenhygromyxa sp. WMMC2535 TaxID=2712867 RepID=UPI0015535994|nr:hypothetical protein [Pseudenhygromyxa sp. WMMC2535]NVB39826.1 hypothetical protein [Pseudenhygromyxa sp. WMMC2535]
MDEDQTQYRTRLVLVMVVTSVAGGLWLLVEHLLRGSVAEFRLDLDVVAVMAVLGALTGLVIRARETAAGEGLALIELVTLTLLIISVLPAVLLVIYIIALVVSASIVAVWWLLWVILLVVVVIIQLVIWTGAVIIFGFVMSESDGEGAGVGGVLALIYAGLVCGLSRWIFGDIWTAWNGDMVESTVDLSKRIEAWDFLFAALRATLASFDHEQLMSLLATITVGLAVALVASVAVRVIRRVCAINPNLRTYLPMTAAPVPDEVPVLGLRLLWPTLAYVGFAWALFLGWSFG